MQQDPSHSPAVELSDVLKEWHIDTTPPPRFREGVWRRIAVSQESHGTRSRFWASLVFHWENLTRKPVGVVACLSLFTAVGIGFGLWHAQAFTLRAETAWQNAYFQSVSPTSATAPR